MDFPYTEEIIICEDAWPIFRIVALIEEKIIKVVIFTVFYPFHSNEASVFVSERYQEQYPDVPLEIEWAYWDKEQWDG